MKEINVNVRIDKAAEKTSLPLASWFPFPEAHPDPADAGWGEVGGG